MKTQVIVAASLVVGLAFWGSWPSASAPVPLQVAEGADTEMASPSHHESDSAPAGTLDIENVPSIANARVPADALTAQLVLRVRGRSDGAVLPTAIASLDDNYEFTRADANGVITLEVPASEELHLIVSERRSGSESLHLTVSALNVGEVRERLVQLGPSGGLTLHGRVMDEHNSTGLPGASILLRDGSAYFEPEERADPRRGASNVVSDEQGNFAIDARTSARSFLIVQDEGYTPRVIGLVDGFRNASDPLEIHLVKSASLEGSVSDESGQPFGQVHVTLEAGPTALWARGALRPSGTAQELSWRWSTQSDQAGRFQLENLPADAPLLVRLEAPGRSRSPELSPLVLAAGERRNVRWSFGARGRLLGRALDASGRPLEEGELWLRPRPENAHSALLVMDQSPGPVDRTFTDEQGHFRFDNVLPGAYILGPAPTHDSNTPSFERPQTVPDRDAVAAVGVELELEVGQFERWIDLEVHRALYFVGSVEDFDGGVPVATVELRVPGQSASWSVPVAADGSFVFGPALPHEHRLRAMPFPGLPGRGSSEFVSASPAPADSAAPIHLRLREARSLSGRVIGARGAPVAATVYLAPVGAPHRLHVARAAADGRFRVDMITAERVQVLAFDGDQVASTGPVDPRSGEVRLDLIPGGRVQLVSAVTTWACLSTETGVPCGRVRLVAGEPKVLSVPAGGVRARRLMENEPVGNERIGVAQVGEVLRLEF